MEYQLLVSGDIAEVVHSETKDIFYSGNFERATELWWELNTSEVKRWHVITRHEHTFEVEACTYTAAKKAAQLHIWEVLRVADCPALIDVIKE